MKYKVHSFTAALILIVMSAQLAFATSASQIPSKFGVPFAASATPGTTIRTIPLMTSTPGAASLTLGFPPITFTPIPSGGMAPDGRDFNGILNASTSWDQWFQLGGPIKWDSTFSTAVGGYPQGALIQSSTTLGLFWYSLVDNNTTNPDSGGTGWISYNVIPSSNIVSFNSSTVWTVPAGVTSLSRVQVWGAGGGGGGSSGSGNSSTGGSPGGYSEAAGVAVTPGAKHNRYGRSGRAWRDWR